VKRREVIAGLGSAAAWPMVARAQQGDRIRRIGVLMAGEENELVYKARVSAFTQALADLSWPQPADGPAVGSRRHQSDRSARAGVGRPATRHHPDIHDPGDRCPAQNRPHALQKRWPEVGTPGRCNPFPCDPDRDRLPHVAA
jgi:hypothetical protein